VFFYILIKKTNYEYSILHDSETILKLRLYQNSILTGETLINMHGLFIFFMLFSIYFLLLSFRHMQSPLEV
jgi:hypothetical protein